jgi:transcriptional regulator with XRE-family HTH domain
MDRQVQDPREVIAGLLDDSRFLGACAERDMGAVFRMLNHRGISTRRIAAAVDITQGRLYDYMNGKSRVEKLVIFEQIADAFHIPGHLLGLARRPWEPAVDAQPHPQSQPDGDDLTAMDAFRSADRQAGGGRLYGAVVQHLKDRVAPRLVHISGGHGCLPLRLPSRRWRAGWRTTPARMTWPRGISSVRFRSRRPPATCPWLHTSQRPAVTSLSRPATLQGPRTALR